MRKFHLIQFDLYTILFYGAKYIFGSVSLKILLRKNDLYKNYRDL
jgi:hypothetical protein